MNFWSFTAYVSCKIQVRNRPKLEFVEIHFSKTQCRSTRVKTIVDIVTFVLQIRTVNVNVNASTIDQGDKLDEKEMASVSIAIVLVFITSNLLQNLYFVLRYNHVISPGEDSSNYLYPTSCVLTVINSSVNVIIYGILDMKFKNSFLSLFWKQKRSRNASRSQSTARFFKDNDNVEIIQE